MKRACLFLFLAFLILCQASEAYDNVLLITIDTLRADYLGCYGTKKVKTPHIDSLATRGAVFRNTVSPAPLTLPSHASLFTGLIPPVHGVRDNGAFYLSKKMDTITRLLKAQGMATAAFVGAFSVDSRFGLDQSFDLYDDSYPPASRISAITVSERDAQSVADAALRWLQQNVNVRWFVWTHFFDPHLPYHPPDNYRKMYAKDLYAGEVAYTDEQIGRILSFLKQQHLEEKTLVVLTSDHGESLGEHGEKTHGIFAYESTLRVPLVIAPVTPKQIDSRVRLIDVTPTILDLMKIAHDPAKFDGQTLVPMLQQSGTTANDSYFEALSLNLNAGWAPLRGFYSGNYKFINLPAPELYDLKQDPQELNNLCIKQDLCEKWFRQFATFLKSFQPSNAAPSAIDPQTTEQLAALGYLSGASSSAEGKKYTSQDDPKNLISLHERAYQALDLFNQKKYLPAIEMLEKIIQERPTYTEAYLVKSFIQSAGGFPDDAVATLKKAIQNGVTGPDVNGKLGFYSIQAKQYEEAIDALKRAIQQDPKNPTHLNYLAMAYDAAANAEAAVNAFRQAYDLDPSDANTLNNWGAFYLKRKQFADAAQKFQAALDANPHIENSYNGLAVSYENLQKPEEAFRIWNLALRKDPNNFDAILHLGAAYLQRKDNKKALEFFTKFEQHAPAEKYREVLPKVRALIQKLQTEKPR